MHPPEPPRTDSPAGRRSAPGRLYLYLPPALAVAVAAALFLQTRHYGLMGFDTYPIIIASRIGSWADFFGTFTESLMDGRYAGMFYRPLLNLTFAVDYGVWGLNAVGYQLTNAVLLAAWAWALHALLRRLLGPRAHVGPLVGLLVFLLSSVHFEVLPVPSRRPELLCGLFMVLAVWLQLSPRALARGRLAWWSVAATVLALASKETAFILPLLVLVAVGFYSPEAGRRERWKHGLIASLPHLAAVVLFALVRLPILGGLGGHASYSVPEILIAMPRAFDVILRGLFWPQAMLRGFGVWVGMMFFLGLIGAKIWVPGTDAEQSMKRSWRAAEVGAAWVVLLCMTYAASGQIGPWYFLLPLAGLAVAMGSTVESLLACVRSDDRTLRGLSLATLGFMAVLLLWQMSFSPLFREYEEWDRATAASAAFFEKLEPLIDGAADGDLVEAPPLPIRVVPRPSGPSVQGGIVLADYSVQAWVELTRPERNVRVEYAEEGRIQPAPDEVLVLITRRLDGF